MRIHLLEAEDLTAKDTVIKGLIDGKSDPYAVLRVGTQIFTSHHVDSNLNPQWREMYEVRLVVFLCKKKKMQKQCKLYTESCESSIPEEL